MLDVSIKLVTYLVNYNVIRPNMDIVIEKKNKNKKKKKKMVTIATKINFFFLLKWDILLIKIILDLISACKANLFCVC